MKTGMEYPLIGLVVLICLVLLYGAWSAVQVDISAAALQATISGQTVPAPVTLASEWTIKALVGAIIGGAVTAFFTALIIWARRQWNAAQPVEQSGKWRGGQNVYWGRHPKAPSESEMIRMMLMQQMAANGQKPSSGTPLRIVEGEDDPTIIL